MSPTEPQGFIRIQTQAALVLDFQLAKLPDRLGAILVDLGVFIGLTVAFLVVLYVVGSSDGEALIPFLLYAYSAVFLLWGPLLEVGFHGRTPGKRLSGLCVIRRDGTSLRLTHLLTRSFLRSIETSMPAFVLLDWQQQPESASAGPEVWFAFALLSLNMIPLVTRRRLRVGDLFAGTAVVRLPRPVLLRDAGRVRDAARPAAHTPSDTIKFTNAQLDIYGVYELETLESVLHRSAIDVRGLEVADVARVIAERIGWASEPGAPTPAPKDFLVAFYNAQRRALEAKRRLGRHRQSQREPRGPLQRPPPPPNAP